MWVAPLAAVLPAIAWAASYGGDPPLDTAPLDAVERSALERLDRIAGGCPLDARAVAAARAFAADTVALGGVGDGERLAYRLRQAGVASPLRAARIAADTSADLGLGPADVVGPVRCAVGASASATASAPDGRVVFLVLDAAVRLADVSARIAPGGWTDLRVVPAIAADGATALLLDPDGRSTSVGLSPRRGELRGRLRFGAAGTYRVQVVLSPRSSPRPAATFDVFVGTDPPAPPPLESAASRTGRALDPSAAETALIALVNGARAERGLSAVAADPTLARLAREHASLVAATRSMSHAIESAGEIDPVGRLGTAGLFATRVGEAVGRGPSAERIHVGFLESPSHRRALLDPWMTHAGIGAVAVPGGLIVTEIFARLSGR